MLQKGGAGFIGRGRGGVGRESPDLQAQGGEMPRFAGPAGRNCLESAWIPRPAVRILRPAIRIPRPMVQIRRPMLWILRLVARICSASGEKTDNPAPTDTTCPRAVLPEVLLCL